MRNTIFKLLLASCLLYGCVDKETYQRLDIEAKQARNEVIIYKNYLLSMQDSINLYKDRLSIIQQYKDSIIVLNEELFIAKYKLERIKEYNRIAADKTQLQFLRGWINRTLNN